MRKIHYPALSLSAAFLAAFHVSVSARAFSTALHPVLTIGSPDRSVPSGTHGASKASASSFSWCSTPAHDRRPSTVEADSLPELVVTVQPLTSSLRLSTYLVASDARLYATSTAANDVMSATFGYLPSMFPTANCKRSMCGFTSP